MWLPVTPPDDRNPESWNGNRGAVIFCVVKLINEMPFAVHLEILWLLVDLGLTENMAAEIVDLWCHDFSLFTTYMPRNRGA